MKSVDKKLGDTPIVSYFVAQISTQNKEKKNLGNYGHKDVKSKVFSSLGNFIYTKECLFSL